MRFDEMYMREVKGQIAELKQYVSELKETVNKKLQPEEYRKLWTVFYRAHMLELSLESLPKPDYSFIDKFYEEKRKQREQETENDGKN